MSEWMTKLKSVLQVVAFIVGAVLSLLAAEKKTELEVAAVSGTYASPADAAPEIAKAGNMSTAGLASLLTTFIIPFVFQMIGKWTGGNKLKPGWNATIDSTSLHSLKHITRVDQPDDQPHIDALIASGVKLETEARINGPAPVVAVKK